MRKILYLLAIALIAFTSCNKDDSNKVLAKVGSRQIKVGEFREAYANIPRSYLPKEGGTAAKKQVMDDLVSKELLTLQAYELGLDKDKELLDNLEKMKEQTLLKELYDREVSGKAKVTEKEMKDRYEQMSREEEIHARHIMVSTPEKAQEVLKRARSGEDFAKLAQTYSEDPSTASKGGDLGFIEKDALLPPEFQDALFKLAAGQVSDVVKTNFGYHIIKADERRRRKLEPFEQMKGTLESNLVRDKINELARNYLDKIRKDYQIRTNEANITALATEISQATTPNGISLAEFSKRFAPEQMARPLATSTAGNYTIKDFLASLGASGYSTLPPQVNAEQIKNMVDAESITKPLVADARKAGIEKEKSFQSDVKLLKEKKMVELLYRKQIRDKVNVSDEEISSYFASHAKDYGQPATVTVAKLVSYDKKIADSLATLARRGADFSKLVADNSIDRESAKREGKVELRVGTDSVIDSLTQKMAINSIAGPVVSGEGFVIIKLLDKKKEVANSLDVARPYVKGDIQRMKEEQAFQALLKKAREKYKPSINEKLLAEIKLETAPTNAPGSKVPK